MKFLGVVLYPVQGLTTVHSLALYFWKKIDTIGAAGIVAATFRITDHRDVN